MLELLKLKVLQCCDKDLLQFKQKWVSVLRDCYNAAPPPPIHPFLYNSGRLLWIKQLWKFTLHALPGCSLPKPSVNDSDLITIFLQETQLLLDSFSSSFSLKVSTEPGNSDVWFQEDKNSASLTAKRLKHYFKWILFLSLIFFFQTNIYKVLSPAGSLFTGEWEWDSVQSHQRGSCFDQCCSARRSRKSRRTKTENLHLPKMRTAGVWNQYWK